MLYKVFKKMEVLFGLLILQISLLLFISDGHLMISTNKDYDYGLYL